MPSFGHKLSIDLDASPSTVWSVIADYNRDPEWREGVRMAVEPAGLVHDGTVTREQLRMFGSWQRTTACIVDLEPGRAFRFVSEDGRVEGARRIDDTPGGSRLTVQLRVAMPSVLSWLTPLVGWMFRRRVRRDLARLRRLVMLDEHRSRSQGSSVSRTDRTRERGMHTTITAIKRGDHERHDVLEPLVE